MAYKTETIKKLVALARDEEKRLVSNVDAVKISISKGNRKIGKVMNVSLMPVITCHNCKECKKLCYDIKACLQYTNAVIPSRMRNTVMAKYDMERFFNEIDEACTRRRKNKYFRWHVAGDILDMDYFIHMVEIARKHPDFVFWTYTKYYSIVNEFCNLYGRNAIPSNFSIMFSKWDGMPMDNTYNFPVFACKLKDGNKDTTEKEFSRMYKCPGNCDICKLGKGRGCIIGRSTYCDEH